MRLIFTLYAPRFNAKLHLFTEFFENEQSIFTTRIQTTAMRGVDGQRMGRWTTLDNFHQRHGLVGPDSQQTDPSAQHRTSSVRLDPLLEPRWDPFPQNLDSLSLSRKGKWERENGKQNTSSLSLNISLKIISRTSSTLNWWFLNEETGLREDQWTVNWQVWRSLTAC